MVLGSSARSGRSVSIADVSSELRKSPPSAQQIVHDTSRTSWDMSAFLKALTIGQEYLSGSKGTHRLGETLDGRRLACDASRIRSKADPRAPSPIHQEGQRRP